MRCNGSHCEKEGLLSRDCFVEEAICFLSEDIGAVFSFVALGWFPVSLEGTVKVVVREWIEKEVLRDQSESGLIKALILAHVAGKPRWEGGIVVVDRVDVEQFTSVVSVVPGFL